MRNYSKSKIFNPAHRAFTLIELLVVIAIIAILAAILFPVFAQAKLAAKKTASLSSVKQISTAGAIYMGDNEDQYTPSFRYNRGDGVYLTWMEMLYPYAKNAEIFVHSSASKAATDYTSVCTGLTANPIVVSHYVYPIQAPWSYYSWNPTTVMAAGFPVTPNEETTAAGGACSPAALAADQFKACIAPANVEGPSSTVLIAPGYVVNYFRKTGGSESNTNFGSSCTWGMSFDPASALTKKISVFNDGANYGMVDTSAKFFLAAKMNRDNSRQVVVNGYTLRASPFMQVK